MKFASDNNGPVHPKIMEAIVRANEGHVPAYGNDALTAAAKDKVREVFEAPEASVFFLPTGTAANSLILGSLTKPWETIFCANFAHIHVDECHAPEAFTNGAKLTPVGKRIDKFNSEELESAISAFSPENMQQSAHGPVSVTQVTERGTLYTLEEIRAIAQVCRNARVPLHMDGARFANAAAALGCTAAEMSWKVGVDAVSFGATKNGAMAVEAAVIFDPVLAVEFRRRQQRAALVFSKSRYLAAQMEAYLTDGLWFELAGEANRLTALLEDGIEGIDGVKFAFKREANMMFVWMPRFVHRALMEAGAYYYIEAGELEGDDPHEPLLGRFVCDWSVEEAGIARFAKVAQAARP
ncbi:MAG: low specificity L-threonine aldolase [Boseongicola sp.]|nr:low specificity L-threonine aldolase [Boseongicola sp.]